jgi:hypothetical protein
MLLSALLACADPAPLAEPVGLPLEIDAGTYSVRAGSATAPIAAVVVVTPTGTDAFTEDWYLSPAGASNGYAAYVKPSASATSLNYTFVYASSATTVPPTSPAPAPGAVRWKHTVSKPG